MIKNNQFYLDQIKDIFFIGSNNNFEKLISLNKKFNLNSFILTHNPNFKSIKNTIFFPYQKFTTEIKNQILEKSNPNNTLYISLSSRWIFKDYEINKIFKGNLINFHNSRLPLDAGGGGYSWRILRKDRLGNILVHLIDSKIDNGCILFEKEFIFPHNCKTPLDFSIYEEKLFFEAYISLIQKLIKKEKINLFKQQSSLRRYNPRLSTEINGWIDWNNKADDIVSFIDAFDDPYPGANTMINSKRVRIKSAHLHGGESTNHPFFSGIVHRKSKNWLVVSGGNKYSIIIEKIFNTQGINIIDDIKEGDRFFTPAYILQSSRSKRVKYKLKYQKKSNS